MYEADMAPAYRWHRQFLQHLQSRHPAGEAPADRWLLKSPAHIWCLGALLAEYPNALLVQTHRDPLRIIASVSSLQQLLRSMCSDNPSLPEISEEWAEYIIEGLDRSVTARKDGTVRDDQIVPFEAGRQLAAGIPVARFIALPGRNHLFLEHEPASQRFFEEVKLFLSR
jgi:pimeloyl-ACP methyl ester carboxylesterase